MEKFTVEEINLMCIYNTGNRAALLADIRESLPHVYDTEMREIMDSVINKLESISDDEFSEIGFFPDYNEEQEE